MITQMSKVEILVLKEDIDKAIGALHNLGLLHIEQTPITKLMEQRGITRLSLSPEEESEKGFCEELIKEINDTVKGIS